MTPIRLSNTWSRRLYVGLFLLSLIYIALFAIQFFNVAAIPQALQINIVVAAITGVVAIGSIVGFMLVKKVTSFLPAFIVYGLFTIATAYLMTETGGVNSPFLAIWTLTIFFAAMFGAYGWLPALIIIGAYIGNIYLSGGLNLQTGILVVLSSLVPLIAGMIIWRDPPGAEDTSEKNVKNLATQLSEVATKSEIVINAIGDGVIALDSKGVIQLINPAAQTILGWGKQDALMLSYASIFKLSDQNGQDLTIENDPIQQVLNNNQMARGNKLMATTQSGKKINVALVVSPIGGPGSGAIAVFRDVTNERAEEREQAEFISTASHEMRTPVASIEGYLGLALNPNTAQIDARARDFIMKAHEAAEHLGRLFQDLLDVSKSEDGRMGNSPKVVDLVTFVETITQGLTQKAANKGLQLIFKPNNEGGAVKKIMPVYYVNQDNDHIREILDNLIENAIKYTPSGSVTVDVTGTEDRVTVSIKDTGLGIPAEDISHLFQKFYRIDNMDRQEIGGTGLGLYLARRLTEAMQGRLWVESTFKEGSTFFFELPRIDSQEATHIKEQQEAAAAKVVATPVVAQPGPVATPPTSIPVVSIESTSPTPITPQQALVTPPVPAPAISQVTAPPIAAAQPVPVTLQAAKIISSPRTDTPPAVGVRPATTVPRGESLTREQIAERVKQLEAMAKEQRGGTPSR